MTNHNEMGEMRSPGDASHDLHATYTPVFTGARKAELDELLTRYPTRMAALLPALWIVQHERGWVPAEGMAEVAAILELTPAYVKGVVSFYTMYHQHPVATHFIQVCTTSPCNVCGAEDVVNALLKQTGCEELGVTSPDGKSLSFVYHSWNAGENCNKSGSARIIAWKPRYGSRLRAT